MFYPESSSLTVTGFSLTDEIYNCEGQRSKEKFWNRNLTVKTYNREEQLTGKAG